MEKKIYSDEEVLTDAMMKKAFEMSRGLPIGNIPLEIHPGLWDDYKRLFNLADEQMDNYFVKATLLEWT